MSPSWTKRSETKDSDPSRRSPRALASLAEELVGSALMRQGWEVLGRNLRHIGYELDLVVAKGRTLAVVEVKARRRPFGWWADGAELLSPRKRRCLERGAQAAFAAFGGRVDTARVDLALVYWDGRRWRIQYYVSVL
jgi:putative endonuclease